MMGATVVVLASVAAAMHVLFLPEPMPEPVTVALRDFQPALSVIDAKPIGSMLYVRVTDWEQLTVEKIRFRTLEVGAVAAAKGLTLAYVVSDTGQGLAEWHRNGGVLVKSRAAQSPPDGSEPLSRSGERTVFTGN
jgi:hypothetical protein